MHQPFCFFRNSSKARRINQANTLTSFRYLQATLAPECGVRSTCLVIQLHNQVDRRLLGEQSHDVGLVLRILQSEHQSDSDSRAMPPERHLGN